MPVSWSVADWCCGSARRDRIFVVGVAVAGIALKGGIGILRDAHRETDKHKEHAGG